MPANAFIASVRHEITRLGGDESKITDEQIGELGQDKNLRVNVPSYVTKFDPSHPVFGSFGDGHIVHWVVAHWDIIVAIAKLAMMIVPLL